MFLRAKRERDESDDAEAADSHGKGVTSTVLDGDATPLVVFFAEGELQPYRPDNRLTNPYHSRRRRSRRARLRRRRTARRSARSERCRSSIARSATLDRNRRAAHPSLPSLAHTLPPPARTAARHAPIPLPGLVPTRRSQKPSCR